MRGAGYCALAMMAIATSDGLSAEQARGAKPPPTGLPAGLDVEFGAGAVTDYNFRGFSVSSRHPSVSGYVRPIYHGFYAGLLAVTLDLPFGSTVLDAHTGKVKRELSSDGASRLLGATPKGDGVLMVQRGRLMVVPLAVQ